MATLQTAPSNASLCSHDSHEQPAFKTSEAARRASSKYHQKQYRNNEEYKQRMIAYSRQYYAKHREAIVQRNAAWGKLKRMAAKTVKQSSPHDIAAAFGASVSV
jgi:hypothetical protein